MLKMKAKTILSSWEDANNSSGMPTQKPKRCILRSLCYPPCPWNGWSHCREAARSQLEELAVSCAHLGVYCMRGALAALSNVPFFRVPRMVFLNWCSWAKERVIIPSSHLRKPYIL